MEINYNSKEMIEFIKKEMTQDRVALTNDQIDALVKCVHLSAAQLLGKNKKYNSTFVFNILDQGAEEYGEVRMHYAVKVVQAKKETEDDNVSVSIGFGEYKPEKKEEVEIQDVENSTYLKRLKENLISGYGYSMGDEWLVKCVSRAHIAIKKFLEENITDEEDVSVIVPGMIEYRINKDTKEISIVADQEIKKRLKSDKMIEKAETK